MISLGNLSDMGKPPRKERRDAAENRQRILRVAEALFAEKGVTAVCMSEIAQAAGVGKGTLYRRFANKADLCLALMDTQMVEFQNSMMARIQQMTEHNVARLSQLEAFLDALVHFVDVHAPLLREVQSSESVDEIHSFSKPYFWQFMTINGLLREAMKNGELATDVDTEFLADALLAALNPIHFSNQREIRQFSLSRISNGLQKMVQAHARN